jgi:Ca2+-binding RTX toxin-like protein
MNDTAGSNLFDGGQGADTLTGAAGNEMFAGGAGNDTITTGNGYDIIAFNRGDGQDILNGGVGTDNTITLGGGIQYSDLALSKVGNDLILEVGNSEQITLKNWYDTTANYKSVLDLQVVADAMTAFDPASSDPLLNKAIQQFDFTAIANSFDTARGANATFMHWSALNTLLPAYLSGSDSAAFGGDVAHQYGKNGTLSGMNLAAAQSVINDPLFGAQMQALQPLQGLQGGAVSLG